MSHRYYLENINEDGLCDAGTPEDHDLIEDLPTVGGIMSLETAATSWTDVGSWDRVVKDDNPAGGSFSAFVDPVLLSVDAEWRIKLEAVGAGCAVLASATSAAYTDATAQTPSIALAWPAGSIRLREVIQLQSTGTGTKALQLRATDNNYLDAPFAVKVPRIRQITDEVVSRLGDIALLRGHNFDVGNTGLKRPPLEAITSTPAVFVWNEEFQERRFENLGDGPLAREATAMLELRLFTHGSTAPQDMILFGADVVDILEDVPRLLGLEAFVVRHIVSALTALKTEQPIEEPWHVATMTVAVWYRMPRGEI